MTEDSIPGVQTGHIGLNVSDLNRSKAFYRGLFGYDLVAEGQEPARRFALLGENGRIVLTLWEQSSGRFVDAHPGLHHLSFEVASLPQVRAFEQKLRSRNIPLRYNAPVPHFEGAESGGIYFEDPDGIRLEIYTLTGLADQKAPSAEGPTCGFF